MGDAPAIAYFTNQYPAVSHTFIRREIRAVERAGFRVERIAVRPPARAVVDAADREEQDRTAYLVAQPKGQIAWACLATLAGRPVRTLRAFARAIRMSRGSKAGVLRHIAYFVEAVVLARMTRGVGVAHTHVHFGTNAATVALLARELGGTGYSLTVHGPDELDDPIGLRIVDKIAGARFVAAISDYTRAQLMRWSAPEDWGKIRVVRCTIDGAYADAAAGRAPEGDPVFVNVGRLSAQKGQLVLIDGFAEYISSGGRGRLVIVGDGELRDEVEARIESRGIGERVSLTGSLPEREVREHLGGATALVLPSWAEGLPMVIMEAFALGVPVISTSIAGIPELVRDEENGFLIPAGRADLAAEAMQRIADTPAETRAAMGRAGRAAVLDRHVPERALEGLIGSLREACEGSR